MPITPTKIRVAEVIMYGQIAASGSTTVQTVTVFHYRRLGTAIAPSKLSLDTIFQSVVADKIVLALNLRWNQLRNTVRWLDDAEDAPVDFTHVNPGAITGDALTTFSAVYIRQRTALKGRSFRGSKHLGPLSESDTTSGAQDVLNAGAVTRFNTIVTQLATDLAAGDGNTWRLACVSRKLSQLLTNPTNVIWNDVTQISLNTRIGRMGRREPKSVY